MAAVRAKNTKPELIVRRGLHARGLRYRLHDKALPGKPDLVFRGKRLVIFVNGCFWHAHSGCRYFRLPETDRDMWRSKLERNRERDLENHQALTADGWKVIVLWECEFRGKPATAVAARLDILEAEILGLGSA